VPIPPTSAKPPDRDRLTIGELAAYGTGGLSFQLGVDAFKTLVNPIFNIVLGVNPAAIGVIMMIARIWDAVLDPLMGWISDNTRSRWGRRKPYIAGGALLSAVFFAAIWFVPRGSTPGFALGWLAVTALLFYAAFTVFCVPYLTLALEMTPSYSERTRITAARTLFGSFAIFIATWSLSFAQSDVFSDTMTGMRVIGIATGIFFIVMALPSVIVTRERYLHLASKQPKQSLLDAFRGTFGNRDFRVLMSLTAIFVIGTQTFNALGIYVNTYHVFGGELKKAAYLGGLVATSTIIAVWVLVPLVARGSGILGKDRMLRVCLSLGIVGGIGQWFAFDPRWPMTQLALPLFLVPASAGFWVIVNSMKADMCDAEEHRSGIRREGAYAAVSSWIQKFSASFTFSLSGLVLVLVGFDQARGADQEPGAVLGLRIALVMGPVCAYAAGLFILRHYSLSSKRMALIRAELEERRSTV